MAGASADAKRSAWRRVWPGSAVAVGLALTVTAGTISSRADKGLRTGGPTVTLAFTTPGHVAVARIDLLPNGGRRETVLREWSRSVDGPPDVYAWSSDGRYLLRAPFGAGDILLYDSALSSISRASASRVDGFGAQWVAGVDRLAYTTFTSARGSSQLDKQLFRTESVRGRTSALWPRRQSSSGSGVQEGWPTRFYPDPARTEEANDTRAWSPPVYFVRKAGALIYESSYPSCDDGATERCKWAVRDIRTGRLRLLPFDTGTRLAVSPGGTLAGTIGPRILVGSVGGGRLDPVAKSGYDPAWSPDGQWLYYVTSRRLATLRFRMQEYCGGPSLCWAHIASPVSRESIWRVRPDGSGREFVSSLTAFALANLEVDDRGAAVFDVVPTDRALWMHRHEPLAAPVASKYVPTIGIEMARRGRRPRVLVADAHQPAVRPATNR